MGIAGRQSVFRNFYGLLCPAGAVTLSFQKPTFFPSFVEQSETDNPFMHKNYPPAHSAKGEIRV